MESLTILAPAGLLALVFALYLAGRVNKAEAGTPKMQEIASAIHEGAMAFLTREYRELGLRVCGGPVCGFSFAINLPTAICFLCVLYVRLVLALIGMKVATRANVRTANAAHQGQAAALDIAFSGGAVMGM